MIFLLPNFRVLNIEQQILLVFFEIFKCIIKNTEKEFDANLQIILKVNELMSKVHDIAEEILDGNVPVVVNKNNLHALCLAAHFDDFVCTRHLRDFRKVIKLT